MSGSQRSKRYGFALALLPLLAACGAESGAGGSGGAPAGGSSDPVAAQACVDAINQYRATLDLPAYVRWTDEEGCADTQAQSDAAGDVAHGAFGTCGESAQNECPGWAGPPATMIPACLKMMWGEGPGADFSKHGHYLNMSNPSYTRVACGFHTLADGRVWAAQDFK